MTSISDSLVRKLDAPPKGHQVKMYDDKIVGFGIRVTSGGRKSFFLNYTCNGREGRITIGHYTAWSVAAARERACVLKRAADSGDDPLLAKRSESSRPTISDLWDRYEREVLPSKRSSTARNERSMWKRLILPTLGTTYVDDLTADAVDTLHRKISRCTRVQANRCMASLRRAYNMAIRWKWTTQNPVAGVQLNPEAGRERYLSRAEMKRFEAALANRPTTPATLALKFILLTGCRKSEALMAEWTQFDLDEGVWTKLGNHTKQKRLHRVPLSAEAVAVLRVASEDNNTKWVFPGRNGKHLVDPKRTFHAVCEAAGIANYRIHDCRHTLASYLVSNGETLPVVGRILGHCQSATTNRYAHLADDPVRRAVTSFAARKDES